MKLANDDGQKHKGNSTPLWRYMENLGGGKGGGNTKFACPHCHKTYVCSSTCVKKHIYGILQWDEGTNIRIKIYYEVLMKYNNRYKKE